MAGETARSTPALSPPAIDTLLVAGLLAGVLAIKARYLLELVGLAAHPGALTYTEGINGLLAARPALWFHPFESAPYLPTIYPLAYHALVGALARLTGASVFQVMHAIALASAAGTGALIAAWRRERGARLAIAVVAGAAYALSPTVTGGTVLGRVDHLAVMLGVLAFSVATREGRGDPLVAAGITIAAMFVKQSMIAFPLAIVAAYWLRGHRRDAAAYAATTGVGGLAILAAMTIATDGRALAQLVGLNAAQPWDAWLSIGLGAWVGFIHLLAIGAAACVLALAIVRAIARDRARALGDADVVLFGVAVAVSLALAGKPGAWTGYFLPALAGGALVFGRALEVALGEQSWGTLRGTMVLLVVTGQFGLFAVWQPAPEYDPGAQDATVETLRGVEGPILSVDQGLLVRLGRERAPHEPQLIRTLDADARPAGAWRLREIRERRFGAIVLRMDATASADGRRWSPDQLRAIRDKYYLLERHGGYRIYVPIGR